MGDTTPPVFLVPSLPDVSDASDAATTVLDGEEAHHAVTVRRLRAGERLALSDGRGTLADCVVAAVRPGRRPAVDVRIEAVHTVSAPPLRVTVAQALAKGDRGELAVELATEAGADAVVPWRAARSVARWDDGPRGEKALAKWRAAARAAAKQARRAWVPDVPEPVTTSQLAEVLGRADLALVLDGGASRALPQVPLPAEGEIVLVVGPEGGVSPEERDAFAAAGARGVRLGPTVLRTSTAAAVALGALGALTGRWR
ncbi:16S rRNA (uracil(1498)-N(3))-methyltransferase [Saccharomonospora piscinae]|uniref:Ribosomal RNA small subunit methyltransferase E n=1 Tax=Saccharomonospora piscinae TaxID=687388 RepID=A0A1V8ZXS9_SACPI|nr:16S rRNA (uracil(1498)-N(3))-methyltransferase [Saccharomonospora piscinae]OQO89601.1 16S rRNA (uracil(1498)-N(3))-methyltransferase [Saccharomonospora piscinae]